MITNSLSKTEKELSIKPYYTDSHCTIYHGDCLDIMAIFPDESIDLIITDPPYNVSHKDKLYRTYKNGKRKDISLDFGEWDYGFDATLFLEESKRVLKKYGQWLIFCSDLQLGDYVEWLKENGYFKQILIWEKLNPPPHFRKTEYRQATEFIVWAYKENPPIKEQHFNFLTQEEVNYPSLKAGACSVRSKGNWLTGGHRRLCSSYQEEIHTHPRIFRKFWATVVCH